MAESLTAYETKVGRENINAKEFLNIMGIDKYHTSISCKP
jgi:hypothetical protein